MGGVLLFAGDDGDDGDERKQAAWEPAEEAGGTKSSGGPSGAPGASASPSAPSAQPSDRPGESGTPSASKPSSAVLPDGFVMVEDPEGFSVAVMDGRQRVTKGTRIDYEAPTGGDHLRIGIIEHAGVSSYDNFRTLEEQARERDDYHRIELKGNTFQGRPGGGGPGSHGIRA